LGSGLAFLTAQLLDVAIFDRLRNRGVVARAARLDAGGIQRRHRAFLFHRLFGTLVVIEPGNDVSWANEVLPLLGFPLAPLWVSMAVADWMVKLALALLALAPFRVTRPEIDATCRMISFDKHKICATIPLTATQRKEVVQCLE
jgi:queuosine precursor transporter